MVKTNQSSAPVCWDCKDRISLDSRWRRFEPSVIPPPAGVFVCGPGCKKAPAGSHPAFESLPTDMMPKADETRQLSLVLW